MSDNEGTSKPVAEKLTLMVIEDKQESGTPFQIKKTTKIGKIMAAFHSMKGVKDGIYRFHFAGKRLNADDTPKMLEMEDGDQIDAFLEAVGGCDGR